MLISALCVCSGEVEEDAYRGRPYYGSHQVFPPYMLKKHVGGWQTARAGPQRVKTDFSTRRASPARGSASASAGGLAGRDGWESRGPGKANNSPREVSPPPPAARARTARPSTFGTSGQWPPPSPPQPRVPRAPRGGGSGEVEMRFAHQPCTLHPIPQIPEPTLQTTQSTPQTPNSRPQTPNRNMALCGDPLSCGMAM